MLFRRCGFLSQTVRLGSDSADDEASSRLAFACLKAQQRHASVKQFGYFVIYHKLYACHVAEITTAYTARSIVSHITHFTKRTHVQYFTHFTHGLHSVAEVA